MASFDDLSPGERVRRHRERLGLTQHQLADRLGLHMRTVTRWEADECGVHWIWLDRLAKMKPEDTPRGEEDRT